MNFEELSKKVKKFSKDTVTEVQKINEVRQLNGKVNEEKKVLEKIYLEMGKKLYDSYKEDPLAGFEEEFRQISQRFSTMDLLQDQIRTVKGVVLCPCCNMEVAVAERFCSNCGTKMPEVAVIEDKVDEDAIEVHSQVVEQEAVSETEAQVIDSEESVAEEPEKTDSEEPVAAEAEKVNSGEAADQEVKADTAEETAETAGEEPETAEETAEAKKESEASEETAEAKKEPEASEETAEAKKEPEASEETAEAKKEPETAEESAG